MGILSKLLQELSNRDEESKRIESFPDPPEPADEEPGPSGFDHFADQGMEPTMNPGAEDDSEDAEDGEGEDGEGEDGDSM